MTHYTLKASLQEADDIAKGAKSFVFRGDNYNYGWGDEISFRVVNSGQMKRHAIENQKFMVTYVSADAPIEKGFKVIGFKRMA